MTMLVVGLALNLLFVVPLNSIICFALSDVANTNTHTHTHTHTHRPTQTAVAVAIYATGDEAQLPLLSYHQGCFHRPTVVLFSSLSALPIANSPSINHHNFAGLLRDQPTHTHTQQTQASSPSVGNKRHFHSMKYYLLKCPFSAGFSYATRKLDKRATFRVSPVTFQ